MADSMIEIIPRFMGLWIISIFCVWLIVFYLLIYMLYIDARLIQAA